jgi:hypothetical protein
MLVNGLTLLLFGVWLIAITVTAWECYSLNPNFKPRIAKHKDNKVYIYVSFGFGLFLTLVAFLLIRQATRVVRINTV